MAEREHGYHGYDHDHKKGQAEGVDYRELQKRISVESEEHAIEDLQHDIESHEMDKLEADIGEVQADLDQLEVDAEQLGAELDEAEEDDK
jgi:hypothetical protein